MEKVARKYFFLCLIIIGIFCFPKASIERVRENAITLFCWPTKAVDAFQKKEPDDLQQLKLENRLLSEQIQQVGDFLSSEERIESQLKQLEIIKESLDDKQKESHKEFFLRREKLLLERLKKQLMSLNGRVIFREPAFWSSYLWIDLGEKDNEAVKERVIAINSPVVSANIVVGVIDFVGKNKSRVRLITDASLSLSTRIVRGSMQNKVLLDHIHLIQEQLKVREDLFFSSQEQVNALNLIESLEQNITLSVQDRYLAKGEIKGSSHPLWRSRDLLLEGIGFNYDFEDSEGPGRDLRTGEPYLKKSKGEVLLKEGDLLVTAGFDGIFPEGFLVGVVKHVDPLEEGAAFYTLKAKSLAPSYHELRSVTVLAPLE